MVSVWLVSLSGSLFPELLLSPLSSQELLVAREHPLARSSQLTGYSEKSSHLFSNLVPAASYGYPLCLVLALEKTVSIESYLLSIFLMLL